MSAYCCVNLDLLLTLNHDARNHEFKICILIFIVIITQSVCVCVCVCWQHCNHYITYQQSISQYNTICFGCCVDSVVTLSCLQNSQARRVNCNKEQIGMTNRDVYKKSDEKDGNHQVHL